MTTWTRERERKRPWIKVDAKPLRRRGTQPQYTFFLYKNHVYKNVEAQITLKFKNVVVILLVAISISF